MPSPKRFIPEEAKLWTDQKGRPIAVVEVTIRTIQGRYLFLPTERHTSLIRGVIGRALSMLDFELYGYAFLSNHGSMLIGVRDAHHLARVMNYIHSNIPRELGRPEHSDWKGGMLERRGRPIVVLGDGELEDRMRYVLSNGTKEHLVARPERYPGAHCARALCTGVMDYGTWIDRTEQRNMGPQGDDQHAATEADATTMYPIHLEQLPCRREMSKREYRQWIKYICREISDAAALERRETGKKVLGARRLVRFHPHYRPGKIAKSPAPFVHCNDQKLRKRFVKAYKAFCVAYRTACEAIHAGLTTFCFPEGGLPPTWYCQCRSG